MLVPFCALAILMHAGCSRRFYRNAADKQAYSLVQEKGHGPNFDIKPSFTIEPDTRSRFRQPRCATYPCLPDATPKLYEYRLPELATELPEKRELEPDRTLESDAPQAEEVQAEPASQPSAETNQTLSLGNKKLVGLALEPQSDPIQSRLQQLITARQTLDEFGQDAIRTTPAVPVDAWNSLPPACLQRMLEFDEVRREYARSFKQPVTQSQLSDDPRINLNNMLELALINSRDYQRRKEVLYQTALVLAIRRFDFDLRFFRTGNGIDPLYTHSRNDSVEVNTLAIPSRIGVQRSLYTAGELAARFANDVLLTFNGPNGNTASVQSEILIELSQPLIQRDIQFEPLTQAERNLVYAARDFVQFRKRLFRDLASDYYALLLTYRNIAINTQDFFSNLSGFNRSDAYESFGRVPRYQVDQFEQNVLRSRGNLITSCNNLERSLDALKLTLGLPVEMPLNVDLQELENLTLSDEATVIRQQISRKREYVLGQLKRFGPDVAVPAAAEVARRMRNLQRLRLRLADAGKTDPSNSSENSESAPSTQVMQKDSAAISTEVLELNKLVAQLDAIDKKIEASNIRKVLDEQNTGTVKLLPGQVLGRRIELIQISLELTQKELQLFSLVVDDEDSWSDWLLTWYTRAKEFESLTNQIQLTSIGDRIASFDELIQTSSGLLDEIVNLQKLVEKELSDLGFEVPTDEKNLETIARLVVEESGASEYSSTAGLAKLEVDTDEAMLTALVQRLDLMTIREQIADAWRDIKYTSDALKGIVNVTASQSFRNDSSNNQPFNFSFDDATTRLGLNFDSPLNRRLERNNYRNALINFSLAFRNWIQAQDEVKFEIRNDLRSIDLNRNQYDIAIASAALAYERVENTRLQLALGQGNVNARDFLEAQQAYTQSLSSVAQRHISYILARIEFFLDLEQLQVDELNYWPELRNESYPFLPNLDFPGTNPRPYGRLACGPWYSDCIRQIERIGPGQAMSYQMPEWPMAASQQTPSENVGQTLDDSKNQSSEPTIIDLPIQDSKEGEQQDDGLIQPAENILSDES